MDRKLFILGFTIPVMEKKIIVLLSCIYVADQFSLHSEDMVLFQIYDGSLQDQRENFFYLTVSFLGVSCMV